MDQRIATQISNLMLEYSGKLDDSIRLVMDNCPETEFKQYRDTVSQLMAIMLFEVMNPIYKQHPELKPKQLE